MPHVILSAAMMMATLGAGAPSDPVRVLLVTGVDYPGHLWKTTTPVLRAAIEEGGRCEVRVVEDPDVLATDLIFDYDVLVLHFQNDKPLAHDSQARANLARFGKQAGKGLVVIHFACGAFPDWPEFGQVIGMIWDKKNTHDPHGPFEVNITNHEHPITKGLKDFGTDDELYFCLSECRPVTVLATAHSKVTGKDHPMAFVFENDRGRVFHTPLGHDAKSLAMPGVGELIRRGTLWVAGREP